MTRSGARRLRLLADVLQDGELKTQRLCDVAASATGVSGAGIMLMSGDVPRGSLCTSDGTSRLIEQLQYELGEGPCIDAHAEGVPVLEPDLEYPRLSRWPAFSTPALDAGVRGLFGFPLRIGAVRLGALNLYRDRPGGLGDGEHADAAAMADITAQAILLLQADAPPGVVADELLENADFQYVVHQAAGMLAAQLDTDVATALVRLRAHAFGAERRLVAVARDVVERRLRFDRTTGDAEQTG